MPIINTHIMSRHSPRDLHGLVSDIKRYPDFIKWIRAMRVLKPREEGGVAHCVGQVVVGFKGFNETFSTAVASDPAAMSVDVSLVRGPFRRLENRWTFSEDGAQTRVDFHLDYEFSNPLLALLAASNSNRAVDKIMSAFLTEADRRFPLQPPAPTGTAPFVYVPFS